MSAPTLASGRTAQENEHHSLPPLEGSEGARASRDNLELGKLYLAAGFSIIVVGADKRPVGSWKDAQTEHMRPDQLRWALEHGGSGLAVVGGKVSGGLTVIDFDVDKNGRAQTPFDLEREFVEPWLECITTLVDPATLPRQRTVSGGWQFYFRCGAPVGNTKVAGVPAWTKKDGEVVVGTEGAPHYAIETRGEGGFAVIPTPGSGRTWGSDLNLTHTPYLEQAVADAILEAAREFDRVPASLQENTPKVSTYRYPLGEGESVINAYNVCHTIEDVLEHYGYVQQGKDRWLAPNSSSGLAGVSVKDGRAYSHHASDPLGDGHAHDAFDVYTTYEHNGDTHAAVKSAALELGMAPQRSLSGPRLGAKSEARALKPELAVDAASNLDLLIYNRTDYGNAERLYALHGGTFRYSNALGFLVWDGRRWRVDEDDAMMMRLALETARTLFRQASEIESLDTRETWVKHALACERNAGLKNAVELVKTIPGVAVTVDELDADPMLLNLENGTIDLSDGTIRAHDPKDLITKMAPVSYDPAAECPKWLEFQHRICDEDADLLAFKQRAYGYSLTGKTSEDVLFIPYGTGANGKSTELTVIGELMGDYATTAQFETFAVKKGEGVRNDIADLVGSRFVSASEGENRQRLAEGLVKQMTGGDTLKARFLHKEYFQFKPAFKLWLATNHKPVIRGTDEGIWRRIRLIPYTVTIPAAQRDKRLREKLEVEKSGILNWLLAGCEAWFKDGLGEATAVSAATATYRLESDALAEFIEARCVTDSIYSEVAGDLYKAYQSWCADNSEDAFTSNLFGRMLTERGYTADQARVEGKVTKIRKGICLAENASEKGEV